MVKVITLLKRKSELSVEGFRQELTTRTREVREIQGLTRYALSLTLPSGYRSREPIYDAVAELWFQGSEPELLASPGYKALQAALRAIATIDEYVVRDHLIIDGRPESATPKKNVVFLRRRPDLSVDQFQSYWRDTHAPLARKIPQIRRYVQAHTLGQLGSDGGERKYDGFALTWFDDVDAMRASNQEPDMAAIREDEGKFLVAGGAPFMITEESIVVG